MISVLDLFSGIGGISLGLEATGHFRTVGFVEIDPFCRRVLAKHWPHVPIYSDVRGVSIPAGACDMIAGGFPCQDVSNASAAHNMNNRQSLLGDRSGLWFEFLRLIQEGTPEWVLIENVSALKDRGLGIILSQLAGLGYDAQWHIIGANNVGLPHRRARLFIIAHAPGKRPQGRRAIPLRRLAEPSFSGDSWENCRGFEDWVRRSDPPRPYLCRSYVGIPSGVDRCKALGNTVVPAIIYQIGLAIAEGASDVSGVQ